MSSDAKPATDSKTDAKTPAREYQVLVMDGNQGHDWVALFADATLSDGGTIRVVQASWLDTNCSYYHNSGGCYVNVAPVRESKGQTKKPSACVRACSRAETKQQTHTPPPFVCVIDQVL
jgi:hypothetical protein